jgi:hypothetical protein
MQIIVAPCCLGNNEKTEVCTSQVQMQFFFGLFVLQLVESTHTEPTDNVL